MNICEQQREIEVLDDVDVLVAGAGVSGCAAAVAAARAGARTMLLERNGVLGGVATAGLMANIGNRYMDRDGRITVHGIAREVIDRMVARGAASEHWACREVPGIVVDSEELKVVLADMQGEAGVRVLTHALAARPVMEDGAVRGAFIESKAGRQAVLAKAVVDCTGEADLAAQAGCPMRWTNGSASLEFKMGGVDLDALYRHFKRHPDTFPVGLDMVKGFAEFERNWVERGIFFFPHGGGRHWDLFQKAIERGEFQPKQGPLWGLDSPGLYGLRGRGTVIVNSNFSTITTLAAPELSKLELESQRACFYVAGFLQRRIPGFEKARIVQMATDLGIRVSRGIEGRTTLRGEQTSSPEPVLFDDVIGCLPASASFEQTGEFFHPHTCDIPYGVLVPKGADGLLVASGKSVSCQPQGAIRGMGACMILGQAAGVAGALAARQGLSPASIEVPALQRALLEQGAWLGPPERVEALGLS